MTYLELFVHRYPRTETFSTALSVDQDLLDLIQGLTSKAVTADVLRERHGMTVARRIHSAANHIVALIEQGIRFVSQARSGPRVTSFLPYYYALLQFAKAVIVARKGPRAVQEGLRHGLSYNPTAKDSHSLDTEVISIWERGVFSLLYEAVTGDPLPDLRPTSERQSRSPLIRLKMRRVYPFLMDASYEYARITDRSEDALVPVAIQKRDQDDDGLTIRLGVPDPIQVDRHTSPLFRRLSPEQGWVGYKDLESVRSRIPIYLLYYPLMARHAPYLVPQIQYQTPRWNGRLQYPEEIPLFLAFFHLGSVVRYKPRFLERAMDSAHLPFLLAADRHCSTKFCLWFYNEMMQCAHFPQAP